MLYVKQDKDGNFICIGMKGAFTRSEYIGDATTWGDGAWDSWEYHYGEIPNTTLRPVQVVTTVKLLDNKE